MGGTKQGFGPSAPVAASVAGALVIAYGGQNGSLYDETWTAGAWAPDDQHATAQVGQLSPAIAALTGGASDTLVVYADPTGTLYSHVAQRRRVVRPGALDATRSPDAAPSLAALAGGPRGDDVPGDQRPAVLQRLQSRRPPRVDAPRRDGDRTARR